MKRGLLLFIYCVLAYCFPLAQGVNWEWARQSIGINTAGAVGTAVACDNAGNVYATGYYRSDSIVFDNIILRNGGEQDFFIVKYSPSGKIIWAKTAHLSIGSEILGLGVATDHGDNVYVTGDLAGDTVTIGNITLSRYSYFTAFVAKYDSNGNSLWANSAADDGNSSGNSIATDESGSVYITGSFWDNITSFDNDTLFKSNPNGTQSDFFITKFSSVGNVIWAKSTTTSTSSFVTGNSIATNKNNGVWVTGSFSGDSVSFGGITLSTLNTDPSDIFVARYDSMGNVLWAKSAGDAYNDIGHACVADKNGNVFVTGELASGPSRSSFFVAEYDPLGNFQWEKRALGVGSSSGHSIATDISGNIYIVGGLDNAIIILDSTTLFISPNAVNQMFLITYDSSRNLVCSGSLESGGGPQPAIATDNFGNTYVCGDFYVNPFMVGTDRLTDSDGINIFVAKFNCSSSTSIPVLTEAPSIQLHPNPFTNQAMVRYSLPEDSKNATLIIYDILGRQRNSYQINNTEGDVNINGTGLSSGVYLYSLVVDGKTLATKKMVVQE